MANANDTFTDTDDVLLQNHTSDSGHTWTKRNVVTPNLKIVSNRGNSSSGADLADYYISAAPANADYAVQADLKVTATGDVSVVISGRNSSSVRTMYFAYFYNGVWNLKYFINGSENALGTYAGDEPVAAAVTAKLDMTGTTIRLLLNGVQRISAINSTITAAGYGGCGTYYTGTNPGIYIDNFSTIDAGGSGPVIPVFMNQYRQRHA